MANEINVDPNLVNQALTQMLSESQAQVATLRAAATQLQGQVGELQQVNQQLKAQNDQLMVDSGRLDGVPQDEEEDHE